MFKLTAYERAWIRREVEKIMAGARPGAPLKVGCHLTSVYGRFKKMPPRGVGRREVRSTARTIAQTVDVDE